MNTQFSVAIHILTLLATEQEPVSSQYIASSINSNATLVRKMYSLIYLTIDRI